MTGGISAAVTALSAAHAFRLSAFFASFAGLSVCLQILSITEGKGVRLSRYLAAKLCQGGIALLLCEVYLRLFQPTLTPSGSVPTMAVDVRFSGFAVAFTLLALCLLLRKKHPLP